jgi:hypothetical protein
MPHTQTQLAPRATLEYLILAGLVIALVVGSFVMLRVEPMRAAIWQSAGPSCGVVALPPPPSSGLISSGTNDNTAAETCFARAFARCHAASIYAYERTGLDTSIDQTFVVEPAILGPCGLADQWRDVVDVERHGFTASCAGLTVQTDGLLVRGCGSLGDILLPAQS